MGKARAPDATKPTGRIEPVSSSITAFETMAPVSEAELGILRDAITSSAHPTVWREMQRQQAVIDELRVLFLDVPEALNW